MKNDNGNLIIKTRTIRNIIGSLILFIVFTLMLGHSVNTSWIQNYFPNGTSLLLIASIVIYIFFGRKGKEDADWNILFSLLLLFFIVFLYSILNGSVEESTKILYIFATLILLYKSNLKYSDIINLGLMIGILLFYMTRSYRTFEINSLAIIFSFGIVGIINFIDYKLQKNKLIIYIILSILSLLFISLSRMRGAVLAMTIIYTYTIVKEMNTNNKKIFAAIVIPLILLFIWNDVGSFFEEYLFANKWSGADITTGRTNIWNYIFSNAGLFGIGLNYIPNYAHAHNTLMHFIGRYGYAILPFVLLVGYKIFIAIRCLRKEDNIKNAYMRLLILWLVFSITETVDFLQVPLYIPQFILLLYFALIIKKEKHYEHDEQN